MRDAYDRRDLPHGIGIGLREPVGTVEFYVAAAAFFVGVSLIVAGVTAGCR